jgi:hypothetical protein
VAVCVVEEVLVWAVVVEVVLWVDDVAVCVVDEVPVWAVVVEVVLWVDDVPVCVVDEMLVWAVVVELVWVDGVAVWVVDEVLVWSVVVERRVLDVVVVSITGIDLVDVLVRVVLLLPVELDGLVVVGVECVVVVPLIVVLQLIVTVTVDVGRSQAQVLRLTSLLGSMMSKSGSSWGSAASLASLGRYWLGRARIPGASRAKRPARLMNPILNR